MTKRERTTVIGKKAPRETKRTKTIRRAVKRAVHDYKEAYRRLAVE